MLPVLLREIAEIKRTGIAFDDGEFNPEVRCIAVPVLDFTGQVIGALGISGPIWRLSNQALHRQRQDRARPLPIGCPPEFGASSVAKSLKARAAAAHLTLTAADRLRKYHSTIEKRLSHSRISRNWKGDIAETPFGRRPTMTRYSRRDPAESQRRLCRRLDARISVDRQRPDGKNQDRPSDAADRLSRRARRLCAARHPHGGGGDQRSPAASWAANSTSPRKTPSIPPPPRPRRSACSIRTASPS